MLEERALKTPWEVLQGHKDPLADGISEQCVVGESLNRVQLYMCSEHLLDFNRASKGQVAIAALLFSICLPEPQQTQLCCGFFLFIPPAPARPQSMHPLPHLLGFSHWKGF